MRKRIIKPTIVTKELVHSTGVDSNAVTTRINEESLFNHFTADIMKMKIKFTR